MTYIGLGEPLRYTLARKSLITLGHPSAVEAIYFENSQTSAWDEGEGKSGNEARATKNERAPQIQQFAKSGDKS